MSHRDDVHVIWTDSIYDEKGKSSDRELPRCRTSTCAALRELLDHVEDLRDGIEQLGAPTGSTFLIPANGFGEFERGGLADL